MPASPQKESPRQNLLRSYSDVRSFTEFLCEPLEVEDYVPQPVIDVSPAKWNIAHTTWFFEEMILKRYMAGYEVFNEKFGYLFNSYYNSIGERTLRDNRGDLSRPTVRQIFEYREYVDTAMKEFLTADLSGDVRSIVLLGLNHEQQHQELFLTDLKYTFAQNPLFPEYKHDYAPEETVESGKNSLLEMSEGIYEIGFNGDGFCFDNELAGHKVFLHDFKICNKLATNADFLEFIDDGGYSRHEFWHSEGWDWIKRNNISAPLYWHKTNGEWRHFTLGGLRKLPSESPVCHVSFYEASAFAEWKNMRLPTEFEWEATNTKFDWGLRWEWTNSAYLPYPGFNKPGGAVGEYNGKFMVNQMVLRGASVVTSKGHSRDTYRNFFHPHLRWQFIGIRLAK